MLLAALLAGVLTAVPYGTSQAGPQQVESQQKAAPTVAAAAPREDIGAYIRNSWDALSRSMTECNSVVDPKVKTVPILYLPYGMATPLQVTSMQAECHVEVRHLPRAIVHLGDVRPTELPVEGLLYLPEKYVVPGGRFNEMYGWDSYFIVLGLEHDGRSNLARGMLDNFFFEIENYGAILNANRTYFFTRSQPPLLTSMIREVYDHPASGTQPDKAWLARAYGYAARDYALWVSPSHQADDTGLARYNDLGDGPVPEMADDSSYYPDVIRWLLAHPGVHPEYLVSSSARPNAAEARGLALESCDINVSKVCAAAVVDGHRLSAAYYKGDRAMRESGFDTSYRFGPFSGSTSNFAPICLNSLLYKYERDMADFAVLLGKPQEAADWTHKAIARRAAIDKYLWDAASGMYLDYDFTTGQRSAYPFVTMFYPLWAGAASAAQATAVEKKLPLFEAGGGLETSAYISGVQWDAPFGWAPTTWLAIAGLETSGFHDDAVRLSLKFRATVLENFKRDGTLREKYNVVSGSANVQVAAGYKSNVVGFGWTNAVYLMLGDLVQASNKQVRP